MTEEARPSPNPPGRTGYPTLQEHLERIQAYLRGLGLLNVPGHETALRHDLAAFLEEHREEIVREWISQIRQPLAIDEEYMDELAGDMRDAQTRWFAHIRYPKNVETYATLRAHANGGFISRHPPSRFLVTQLKIREIAAELLQRRRAGDPSLPKLLRLLDQDIWERVLHITDFFVEAREGDLADQAESYRQSIDGAPVLIFNVDAASGTITAANQVAHREVSSDHRGLTGRALWDLHPESERGRVQSLFRQALAERTSSAENLHLQREGREALPADLRTSLIEYGDHRFLQAMYVDLSERRRLEFQLIQSEKMAAIGQLAAGIAHEIRNPLGIIMNALYDLGELLSDPRPEVQEDLQIARAEMARVQEIINNLLEFSRDSKTDTQTVDVNQLVERTLKLMTKYLQNHGVEAVTELGDVTPCLANENGLRQVLLNLITNAVQAMPTGGRLTVATEASDHCVCLRVSDNGTGIPQEEVGKIFDPFFTTKAPGEGTGLGLSVVHSVVENAGGTIQVQSAPDRGTTFRLSFPCGAEAANASASGPPRGAE